MTLEATEIGLLYYLEGAIAPKARPRFNGKNAYLPSKYREWREDAELQLISQSIPDSPLEKVAISVRLRGKHSRRGDADNIIGSILDALVAVGILKDDNLTNIPKLSIELDHQKNLSPLAEIDIDSLA